MNTYKDEFLKAVELARSLGYDYKNVNIVDRRIINQSSLNNLSAVLQQILGSLSPYEIAAQCFITNLEILPAIESVFNCKVYYTLGYYTQFGEDIFKFTQKDIELWLKKGIPEFTNINMHAWITLDSTEIIDVTLLTSIGVATNNIELIGTIINSHPNDFDNGMVYHPVVLGHKILQDIGVLRYFIT